MEGPREVAAPARVCETARPMSGLSEHARQQVELHRQVAHMYRRRSQWAWAEAFQEERNALLMDLVPARPQGVALDLGCGTGVMLDHLGRRFPRVLGLDLSQEMLEGFDLTRLRAGLTVSLLRGDMAALPLRTASVDVIVCRSALHHMDDEAGVLREIARVLEPGGLAVLDLMNPAFVRAGLRAESVREGDEFLLRESRALLDGGRRVVKDVELRADGEVRRWREDVRLYELSEFRSLARDVRLELLDVRGGFDDSSHSASSPRMLVRLRRG